MRWAWFFGGVCFAGVALVCAAAEVYPFMWGAGTISVVMFLESAVYKEEE